MYFSPPMRLVVKLDIALQLPIRVLMVVENAAIARRRCNNMRFRWKSKDFPR